MATIPEALAIAIQHHETGRLREAEQIYRQILAVEPNHAESLHLLGVLACQVGEHDVAIQYIGRAIELKGTDSAFHSNLGNILAGQGKFDEAVACYRRALELEPGHADAHNNLGIALKEQGRLVEAIACYRRALEVKPDSAVAHNNLGGTFKEQGNLDEAVVCYRRALELKPDYAEAHNNLGNALKEQGNVDEAVACLRQALELKPTFPEAHCNLGNALKEQGKLDEAVACLRQALELKPDYTTARDNLLYVLNYDPMIDDQTLYDEHLRYGEVHDFVGFCPKYANQPDPRRRLRIGYVSPDFRRHPVAYFIEQILRHHDPQEVEVFLYNQASNFDDVTTRMRALPHAWRDIRHLNDRQAAELIRADNIDILVDIAGHTAGNRLPVFALRPSPVQVTYLGYPNTTGMKSIQYLLTDAITDPLETTQQYTERIVRLPHGYCCFYPPQESPKINPLPALTRGQVTFGSLHALAKLNAGVLDVWCDILRAVPESRLLLYRHTLKGATAESFARKFAQRGIPAERVEIRHEIPLDGFHLSVYHDVDVALDTFPWCGHTTACESLWMGVPIVTLCGNRHASRLVSSVSHSAGLDDWVVALKGEYVQRAVRAAADLPTLAKLRSSLRALVARSALCDAVTFTHDVEQAYREMWRNWCMETN